jgi:hypothetical protein
MIVTLQKKMEGRVLLARSGILAKALTRGIAQGHESIEYSGRSGAYICDEGLLLLENGIEME